MILFLVLFFFFFHITVGPVGSSDYEYKTKIDPLSKSPPHKKKCSFDVFSLKKYFLLIRNLKCLNR